MRIPFITKKKFVKRKGGGGGGRGGSSGGGSSSGGRGGSSGGSSGSSSGGRTKPVPISSGPSTGGRSSATVYGNGGGKPITIPSGQPFAGRAAGGATRNNVYGTSTYGSGYPGIATAGVSNRGFPFFFWPMVWGSAATVLFLDADSEYGGPSNSSRPGGQLTTTPFTSNNGSASPTTLRLVADNATTTALITAINVNCSSSIASNTVNLTAQTFTPSNSSPPRPEEAVQYYRASSVALTLDGYNNSAAYTNDTNAPNTALPSGIDLNFLDCINQTVGAAVPLIGASSRNFGDQAGVLGPVGCVFAVMTLLFMF